MTTVATVPEDHVSDCVLEKRILRFIQERKGCALLPQLEQVYVDYDPKEKNLALEIAIRGPSSRVFLWGFRERLHNAILRLSTRGDLYFGLVKLNDASSLVKTILQGRNYERYPLVTQFQQLKEDKERWLLVAVCTSEKEARRRFNNIGHYTSFDPDTGLAAWKWQHANTCPRCATPTS